MCLIDSKDDDFLKKHTKSISFNVHSYNEQNRDKIRMTNRK